jgi:hypothetical protein
MTDVPARALLVQVIEHLSLEVDDPDRWPDLEAILAVHLSEAEAKGLEEAQRERDTPEIIDFMKGVQIEAAHQRERWGTDHDGGKTDADWFWLVGYLVGKALHLPEKRLHHLITAAAALANWHLYTVGKTNMRPGIEPPEAARGGGG